MSQNLRVLADAGPPGKEEPLPKTMVQLVPYITRRHPEILHDHEVLNSFQSVEDEHNLKIKNLSSRVRELEAKLAADPTIDVTSQLPNSTVCRHRLAHTVSSERQNYAIMLIDIFKFKMYNDRDPSYELGNRVLRRLGQIFYNQLRPKDFAGRWLNGDELFIIMTELDSLAGAIAAAKRVEEGVLREDWVAYDSRLDFLPPSIDASIVFVYSPEPHEAKWIEERSFANDISEDIVKRAAALMVASKQTHRETNRPQINAAAYRIRRGKLHEQKIPAHLRVTVID